MLDAESREDLIERITSIFTNEADARAFNEDPEGFAAEQLPDGTEGADVADVLPEVGDRTGLDFSNVASTGGGASAAGHLSHTYETIYQQNSVVFAEQGAQVANVQGNGNAVAQQQGTVELDADFGEGELDSTDGEAAPPVEPSPPVLPDGTPTLVRPDLAQHLDGLPMGGDDAAFGGIAPAGPLDHVPDASGGEQPPPVDEPGDPLEGGTFVPGQPPPVDTPLWEEPIDYGGMAGPTDDAPDEAFAQGAGGFGLPDGTPTLARAGLGDDLEDGVIDAYDTSPVIRPGVDDATLPASGESDSFDDGSSGGPNPDIDLDDSGGYPPGPADPPQGESGSEQAGAPSMDDSFDDGSSGGIDPGIDLDHQPASAPEPAMEEPIDYGGVAGPPDDPFDHLG